MLDLTLLKDDFRQCRQSNNQLKCPIKSNCLLELSSGVCAILITLYSRGERQQLHDLCQCDLCGCVPDQHISLIVSSKGAIWGDDSEDLRFIVLHGELR